MCRLASRLSEQTGAHISIGRGNVGYSTSPATWACHESYLSQLPPKNLMEGLIPFLCSRVVYCGGGGFDPFSHGISFTLSPRIAFVSEVASTESTCSRGIVHLRDETLSQQGLHRLHLLCGDALGSELGMWLRAGVTALVVRLLDQKYGVPADLTPADPLNALRQFACDPTLTCKVPTVTGQRVSALDIQWGYLNAIERNNLADGYPDWAPMVLEGWRRILEILQYGPTPVATALDWPIKLQIYSDFCAQFGITWEKLPDWNSVIDRIWYRYKRANLPLPESLEPSILFGSQSPLNGSRLISTYLRKHDLDIDQLPRVSALRHKLFELETRYLQNNGLFEQLESAGVLDHVAIPDRMAISEAVRVPPKGTRAEVRGECVNKYHGQGAVTCSWLRVTDGANRRTMSLENPLSTSAEWQTHIVPPPPADDDLTPDSVAAIFRQAVRRRRANRQVF